MTTAIIKLTLRLPTGRQRQTQWEFDAGRRSRISDAAEEGCRRLGVDVDDFNFDFAEEFDSEDEPKLNLLPDEMVQPCSVYIITDQQLNHRQSLLSSFSTFFNVFFHFQVKCLHYLRLSQLVLLLVNRHVCQYLLHISLRQLLFQQIFN